MGCGRSPALEGYTDVFDDLYARAPAKTRALHHTRLNMGASTAPALDRLARFTNELARRYDLRWVNEDLGIWHLCGKILPYPLPPPLTDEGVERCVRNVRAWMDALEVPLRLEFPGFSDGASFYVGPWDAYDFFREVVERSGVDCTLDVGHLLGWRWLRGQDLYADLDRLPLASCVELHLSGCAIVGGRFHDAHHGVLLDEQLELTQRLMRRCPNLRTVTYEDPRFDEEGALIPRSRPGYERLKVMIHG